MNETMLKYQTARIEKMRKQSIATEKYNAKTYDEIKIRLPKGQKAKLKTLLADNNMSMNQFVTEAMEAYKETLIDYDIDCSPAPKNM